jgi:hypothetical protein
MELAECEPKLMRRESKPLRSRQRSPSEMGDHGRAGSSSGLLASYTTMADRIINHGQTGTGSSCLMQPNSSTACTLTVIATDRA